MRKPHRFSTVVLAPLCCAISTACSSGSGGSGLAVQTSPAAAIAPATTTSTSGSPTLCAGCVGPQSLGYNFDTRITAGPIAAPPPASFGSAPAQVATSSTPTFDGSSGGYPANVTFPLISTSLRSGSSGLSAGPASTDATLTVYSTSANSTSFQLVIPALNLNVTFTNRENIASNMDGWTWGYSYVAVGSWGAGTSQASLQSVPFYSFGYETPGSGMPTTGTAQFAGTASANVFQTNNGTVLGTRVDGKANLSVNFSSGQLAGSLTQMQQWDGVPYNGPPGYLPWNDVSLNASIAPGTNRFNGSAAATSAPGTSFSLAGSATGNINGAFYGPSAQNVGAVWSLSDGSKSAIGGLAAKQ